MNKVRRTLPIKTARMNKVRKTLPVKTVRMNKVRRTLPVKTAPNQNLEKGCKKKPAIKSIKMNELF